MNARTVVYPLLLLSGFYSGRLLYRALHPKQQEAPPAVAPATPVPAPAPDRAPALTLLAPDGLAENEAVDPEGIHVRGDRLFVATRAAGAPGRVRCYRFEGGQWRPESSFEAPEPGPDDQFGFSISCSGERLAVGAPRASLDGVACGAVWTYELDEGAWVVTERLDPSEPVPEGRFGNDVSLDPATGGDRLAVGEGGSLPDGTWRMDTGGATVFERRDGAFERVAVLSQPDSISAETRETAFAHVLDLDGDWLCVTALMRNAVAMYRRTADGWALAQTIEGPTDPGDAATGPGFGRAIDLDGDTLVVGALRAGGAAPDVGAVFVYAREGEEWRLAQRLADPGGSTLDMYGHWVAHDDGRIAVGAFRKAVAGAGAAAAGVALLYRRDGDAFEQAFELAAPTDPPPGFTAYTLDYHAGHLAVSAGTAGAGPIAPHCFTAEFR